MPIEPAKRWSKDGRYVLYHQTNLKFLAKPMFGSGKPFVVLDTPFLKDQAKFSPDNANNSGRFEVYVTSFPHATEQIPCRKTGASSRDGEVMAVSCSSWIPKAG
jgi:hypothetical protein